jgi:hypothetical protein
MPQRSLAAVRALALTASVAAIGLGARCRAAAPPPATPRARPGDVAALPGDVAALPGDVAALPGDVAALPGDAAALPYSLPRERITAWNPGLNAVGGIPHRAKIFKTLNPSGGDDTAAIQSALDTCPANQVVLLGPGTFKIKDPGLSITASNITLRGSGPAKTRLVQGPKATMPVVIIGERWFKRTQPTPFASDAVKETNKVVLVRNPGLAIGELVHVSETYDPSLIVYDPERQNGDYQGWGDGTKGPREESRPIGQAMEIAAINGNEVTFATGLHIGLRTSHGARLSRICKAGGPVIGATKWSGIENLAVADGGGGDGGGNIRVFASAYSWARNIESSGSEGAAFAFEGSFRCEVRDSYLHSTSNPNPGGAGYGLHFDSYTADSLAENNIIWNFNKVMVMRSSGGGNVVGYNYLEDGYGQGYPEIVEVGMSGAHQAGAHYELFEGNQAFNYDSDSGFGGQLYLTVFRNHLTTLRRSLPGVKAPLRDVANRRGIGLTVNQWWHSFVGNVIGYPDGYLQSPAIGHPYPKTFSPEPQGRAFKYEWLGGPFGHDNHGYTPMWQLGYDGSRWFRTQDKKVQATTLRDANYDYFTRSVRWHGIGGTGAGTTPSPTPVLPNSLYLKSKPAFFGSNPWPWVDGSGAVNPLPGTLPARVRFDEGKPNG